MHRFLVCLLAVALAVAGTFLASPANAWEFGLKGSATFEYEMIGQTGRHGFFGPYDYDSTGGNNYSSNFWPGLTAPGQVFGPGAVGVTSSSDVRWQTQYAEFIPHFQINPAVDLEGCYYIGGWYDPLLALQRLTTGSTTYPASQTTAINTLGEIQYLNGIANVHDSQAVVKESAGAHQSMSPGYWNWFRLRAQLPWGVFTVGKRATAFGMGLIYDGYTSDSTSVSLAAPYGPFTIGWSIYPSRRSDHGAMYSPIQDDGSNTRPYQFTYALNYADGPLQTGFQVSHTNRWDGAERVAYLAPTTVGSTTVGTTNSPAGSRERTDFEVNSFLKYNNGRFFFNAEFDYYWRKQLVYPTIAQKNANNLAQIYNNFEALVYGTEFGMLCGPTKLSFLMMNATDDDRRAVSGQTDVFTGGNYYSLSGENGNTFTVCRPYAYLMGFTYGGGVLNGYDFTSGIGHLKGRWTAGTLYGARLDYAVAANLNVFVSGAKGVQWNKSYGWGYIGLNQSYSTVSWATKKAASTNGARRSPAIPNDDLGWEVGTGFDWKLLEGLVLKAQYSYWQPGDWFKWACVSRTNPLWKTPTTDLTWWGTTPDRAIDAIYGVNVLVVGEF